MKDGENAIHINSSLSRFELEHENSIGGTGGILSALPPIPRHSERASALHVLRTMRFNGSAVGDSRFAAHAQGMMERHD